MELLSAHSIVSRTPTLPSRNTLDELFDVLQHATDVFPEAGLYVEAARARIKARPTIVARKLGPVLTPSAAGGSWKEQLGRQQAEEAAAGPSIDKAKTVVPAAPKPTRPSRAATAADKQPRQQPSTESSASKRVSSRSRGGNKVTEPTAPAPDEAVAAPHLDDGSDEAGLHPLPPPGAGLAAAADVPLMVPGAVSHVPLMVPGTVSHVPRIAAKRSLRSIAPGSIAAAMSLVPGMGCGDGEGDGCRPTPPCAMEAAAVPSTEASAASPSTLAAGPCEDPSGACDAACASDGVVHTSDGVAHILNGAARTSSGGVAEASTAMAEGGPWWTVLLGEGGEPEAAAAQSGHLSMLGGVQSAGASPRLSNGCPEELVPSGI